MNNIDFENMRIHFMDNDPNGVRRCQIDCSRIQAYILPYHLLSYAKRLGDEVLRHGVYFLINDSDELIRPVVYAGKTENGIERLLTHKSDKDKEWTLAVMFLADDEAFTLDVIRALETVAIRGIKDSTRYDSSNKKDEKFEIGIYQRQTVRRFFSDIKFIMASLGYGLDAAKVSDNGEWHTSRHGLVANGRYANGKFDVLPGSQIDMTRHTCSKMCNDLRKQLIDKGILVRDEKNGCYILMQVQSFKSPSGAGEFVVGTSSNGWGEWKNDKGELLDILRR